jgi:hypothetical protein
MDSDARQLGVKSAVQGDGLSEIMRMVRTERGANGLTIQIRTRNSGMNQVMSHLGHQPVATRYLTDLDGLAGPGTFHIDEITPHRSD